MLAASYPVAIGVWSIAVLFIGKVLLGLAAISLLAVVGAGCGGDDTSTDKVIAYGLGVESLAEAGDNLEAAGYTTAEIPLDGAGTTAGANGRSYTADAALSVQFRPDGSSQDVSVFEYSDPVALKQVAASYEDLAAEGSSPLGYAVAQTRLCTATDGVSETAEDKITETMKTAGEAAPE